MDGTTGIRMQVPAGLFLCAGAVLESPRLAKGSPVPRRCLNGDPGVPKCAPRLPKVLQRGHKGPQKRDKRSAMRSPEHALALQSAFKGVPYTPKLPINRTSGHYVSNICCSIISTITIRIIITIISTDTITITLLSLLLYYYWWGGWGLVCPARPPERRPRPGACILLCYYYY